MRRDRARRAPTATTTKVTTTPEGTAEAGRPRRRRRRSAPDLLTRPNRLGPTGVGASGRALRRRTGRSSAAGAATADGPSGPRRLRRSPATSPVPSGRPPPVATRRDLTCPTPCTHGPRAADPRGRSPPATPTTGRHVGSRTTTGPGAWRTR